MNIIAIGGRMGAGKTTLAKYLSDRYHFHHMSLAAPLKRDIVKMGFPEKLVYEEKPDHVRALMQAYGQAWRALDENHWLDLLFKQIAEIKDRYNTPSLFEDRGIPGRRQGPFIVIDDLRFPNEMEALKDIGAFTVRVVKADPMRTEQFVGVRADTSEMALNNYIFDGMVTAAPGAVSALHLYADTLMQQLGWF